MQRPIWKGHLRLALVTCPVALYAATHERGAVRFNMLNPKTGNRIKMVTQDAETEEPISRGETVKGYEFERGRYVVITDEDLAGVKVDSSELMTIEKFVPVGSIDPVYYDSSYYLAPNGKAGEDVYAVLREAIARTGTVALSRVVISQRERTVALRPVDGGLAAHTLNEERDLNAAQPLFESVSHVHSDPAMVDLAVQLIERQTAPYDPADLEDRYETRLRAMLAAKVSGEKLTATEPAPAESNVIDLMAALRKSLGEAPAEAAPAKATPKRAAKRTEQARAQPGLKLPIAGGKKAAAEKATETAETARPRKRA
jgi:DNA end-binding protein Ku